MPMAFRHDMNTYGYEPVSDDRDAPADALDGDDLATILAIAHNGQSGRITEREIKLLVEAYLTLHKIDS